MEKEIYERKQNKWDMEKSQTQDSFLLLVSRFNISFVSLGNDNMNDILYQNILMLSKLQA